MKKILSSLVIGVCCVGVTAAFAAERKVSAASDRAVAQTKSSAVTTNANTIPSPGKLPTVTVTSPASPASGEQIKWQVISGGGNRGISTNFILSGTIGQTAAGPAASTNYKVNSGFWQSFASGGGCCAGVTGNVDCDPGNGIDISDLSALIDNLYISFTPLCCTEAANTDGQPGIDISDLSALIDYLYINFTPTAPCM